MHKKIRVLQFSQLINRYDFMDVIVRNADPALFEMMACTFTHNSNIQKPEYDRAGYEHISLDLPFNKPGFFRAVFRLAQILRKKQVDVVHAHHYYEAFIARLAIILYPQCKLVITRHYHNELFITTKGLKLRLYLFIEKMVSRKSCIVISPSTQITELLVQAGVDVKKIRAIPYGFDFTAEKYSVATSDELKNVRQQIGADERTILIGNFARHHHIKGQDLMLRSFAEIVQRRKDVRLVMVGNGPFHTTLVSLAKELNIEDHVNFLGWQKEIRPFLSAMDIVWHPTRQEAFPQIMIESMALSRVLCITPVSGATDVIEDGVNGFLIPFNPETWTSRLLSLLENRESMVDVGANARKSAMALDIKHIIKKNEAAYLECV